jgi:hypothetical protein
LIGRERIAVALATGTIHTLGISEVHKPGCRKKTPKTMPAGNSKVPDLKRSGAGQSSRNYTSRDQC